MRRFALLIGTVLVSSILAVSQTPAAKPLSAFDQQLIDQQKQFLQATDTRNTGAVDRTIAEDFQGIAVNGDFYDRGEILDATKEAKPKEARAYDFHVIKLNDDSAIVAYNLIMPGEHPRYRHMSDTWVKTDGQWKLKFRQVTANLWAANDLD
jgi:hypothetical protein